MAKSSPVKFVDEPPVQVSRSKKFADEAKALRDNPGKWALIVEGGKSQFASSINNGKLQQFSPKGSFEATSRRREDEKGHDIYARYVGASQA